MKNLFDRLYFCYLTNRCEDAFQLIKSSKTFDEQQQTIFTLISLNLIEKRCQSLRKLNQILIETNDQNQCFIIQNYLQFIFNELQFYSKEIFSQIENLLSNRSISLSSKVCYQKLQGDLHFLLSQVSKSNDKLEHINHSLRSYNQALDISSQQSLIHQQILRNKNLISNLFDFQIV